MEICSCRMTKTATVFYSSQGNICKRKQKYRNKKDKGGMTIMTAIKEN